ncbi:MAG: DNA repair protein RecN [Planctomycetes bacterium]|nr:DNA repair protein RecN [Planctomycetota bacterium]
MLAELTVENLVLIERVQLELDAGFNVFTGETGAGKSLLIDALNLLFGAHASADAIRPGAEQAAVSARFVLHDAEIVRHLERELGIQFDPPPPGPKGSAAWELVVSRAVPREGRARAHANGRPVALAALKTLAENLLDLHGQHENQSLLRAHTRLEILDRFAGAEAERAAVRDAWDRARAAAAALADLRRAARDREGRQDLYRFQYRELQDARLDEFDPAALADELKVLQSAEHIQAAAAGAAELLDGDREATAAMLLARAQKGLDSLGDAGADAQNLAARLDGLLAEIRELARDCAALAEKATHDPERLAELEDLHARARQLERKHGRDVEGLRALRDDLKARLGDLDRLDIRTGELEAALEAAVKHLRGSSAKLTKKRAAAARALERSAAAELADLGLKGVRLELALVPHAERESGDDGEAAKLLPGELRVHGAEACELRFSANPELPLKPLAECASGGELSRVMLALKTVLAKAGGADRLPVVVFDEVDTGVGGRTGSVLGRKLAALAHVRQVLCVTHLPQVAAYAHRQVKVEKLPPAGRKGALAQVQATVLDEARRVDELALMLRGEAASSRTRAEAAEMLKAAREEAPPAARNRRKA